MSIRFLIQEHKKQKMKSESKTEDVAAKLHIASLEAQIKRLEQDLAEAKKESLEAKQNQARYLKLIETGNFCPTQYSGIWGLHMSGTPYTKAELDAPIDAAIKESSK